MSHETLFTKSKKEVHETIDKQCGVEFGDNGGLGIQDLTWLMYRNSKWIRARELGSLPSPPFRYIVEKMITAAAAGDIPAARDLLWDGNDPNASHPLGGWGPPRASGHSMLNCAAAEGQVKMIQFLRRMVGVDLNIATFHKATPISIAIPGLASHIARQRRSSGWRPLNLECFRVLLSDPRVKIHPKVMERLRVLLELEKTPHIFRGNLLPGIHVASKPWSRGGSDGGSGKVEEIMDLMEETIKRNHQEGIV